MMASKKTLQVVAGAVGRLTSIAGLINSIAEHKIEPGPHTDRQIIEAAEALDDHAVQVLLNFSGALLKLMGDRPEGLEDEDEEVGDED